ncbi:MAG: ribonuclease III [Clostridia bacterium]|nr:ribonuclease III [Clostridia bacterium]
MTEVERRIGYEFKDKALLKQALTHPSYGGDHRVSDYQRLEFLGNAVLELYISDALYREYPDLGEGKLTRMRADLVRESTLSAALTRLGLSGYILLSVGEERGGGREKPAILCDVFEAVIGAIYLDGGRRCAGNFILAALGEELRRDTSKEDHLDDKSRLQSVLQAQGDMPVYELLRREGPDHAPVFTYRVCASGTELGQGSGPSKQAAQLQAAAQALALLAKKSGER